MIINTTLSQLDETIDKYYNLLGWSDGDEVHDGDMTHLGIYKYRIQIPSLNLSLRSGDLMSQHGGEYSMEKDPATGKTIVVELPPPEDAEWEVDASCVVIYEQNEMDLSKFLGWSTGDFQGAVYEYLNAKDKVFSDFDDIPCFIDTKDFMKDEKKAMKYAKECEVEYDEESNDTEQ